MKTTCIQLLHLGVIMGFIVLCLCDQITRYIYTVYIYIYIYIYIYCAGCITRLPHSCSSIIISGTLTIIVYCIERGKRHNIESERRNSTFTMKSTKVQNPRRISYSILAYSHCKLVTVSRAARTQEGRVG